MASAIAQAPTTFARAPHQRAKGEGRVAVVARDGVTRLADLYQQGCCKIRLPDRRSDGQEVVLINSSGGMTAEDDLRWHMTAGKSTHLTISTQACERVYRCNGDPARLNTTLTVEDGARLDWVPQETIMFDGGRLNRKLTVDLQDDAEVLIVEPLLFGRMAMDEQMREGSLRDRWDIRRDGRLIHREALDLEGDVESKLASAMVAGEARAAATILFASPKAEALHETVRQHASSTIGIALFDDRIVVRCLARDGYDLRAAITPVLRTLRDGRDLPKVWNT
ncbi:urease accessory protein UreD [Ahrensia sp. R2A130]|uniref:urease accessory protein UreD n=1 Tax=Ahrensia sp. R2A130 TaxID=744979 RepID=UPI0001E0ACBA|nr:urease accessory protein UreD [Ahrensia sp. R2A130]EFL88681.1 urease accessory protein UreD [Ahrensia sp. R2A130]